MDSNLARKREDRTAWASAMKFAGAVYHLMRFDFYDFHRNGILTPGLRRAAKYDDRFPGDPDTSNGRRLLWRTFERYETYYASIPQQCLAMLQIVTQKFTHRRKDTLRNILYVAEAIIHRASYEKDKQVLFGYESLRTWVKEANDHDIGFTTLKTVLTYLNNTEFFDVKFGIKSDISTCTTIKLHLNPYDLADLQATYDWQERRDWVMTKVIDREVDVHDQRVIESSQADSL